MKQEEWVSFPAYAKIGGREQVSFCLHLFHNSVII